MDFSGPGLNYILAAFTIILGIMLAFLARMAVRWLESKAGDTNTQWDDILIAAIGTPVQFTIIVLAVYYGVTFFDILPDSMRWILDPSYATAFYILISAWILATVLHSIIHIYGRRYAEQSETDLDDRLVELLELVIRYVIWFAAIMAILKVFNIDITPLLAGAGIAGIAVALAAQDLISNFFGGAIITVQGRRPDQGGRLLRGCNIGRHPQYADQDAGLPGRHHPEHQADHEYHH
jgi:MscS family membrane protein